MTDGINQKINLARYFLRIHDYHKARAVLREVEQIVLQTPDYPYWAALTQLLEAVEERLGAPPPASDYLSDGGDEWSSAPPEAAGVPAGVPAGAPAGGPAEGPVVTHNPPVAPPTEPAPGPTGAGGLGAAIDSPPPTDHQDILALEIEGHGALSPGALAEDLAPFAHALELLQRAINAALGAPNQPVIVRHAGQNGSPQLHLSGADQAAQMLREVIVPWRAENATRRRLWAGEREQFANEIERAHRSVALAVLERLPGERDDEQRWLYAARMRPALDVLMFSRVSLLL